MLDTKPLLLETDFPSISRQRIDTIQVNLGYLCNLSCTHCHVNAGPNRTELMSRETIDEILSYIDCISPSTLDLTGGAPEMNPHFSYFVTAARERGLKVIDRCNLTILVEPAYHQVAEFLAEHRVSIVASLPCYSEKNVSEQRGKGVFQASIEALKHLNSLGYGQVKGLELNLVYNPNGMFLPPNQQQLELDYKATLKNEFDIYFNQLLTITNMPISRFGGMLLAKNLYHEYMQLLKDSYTEANLDGVMCKTLLSIDWQGYVYDCDFNQMLDLPLQHTGEFVASDKQRWHIRDLLDKNLTGEKIVIGEHCYGCTAGQGSSCGGALV